jgi:hypothetical protein
MRISVNPPSSDGRVLMRRRPQRRYTTKVTIDVRAGAAKKIARFTPAAGVRCQSVAQLGGRVNVIMMSVAQLGGSVNVIMMSVAQLGGRVNVIMMSVAQLGGRVNMIMIRTEAVTEIPFLSIDFIFGSYHGKCRQSVSWAGASLLRPCHAPAMRLAAAAAAHL